MTRAPFSRYGGKYYMLGTILPLLPPHEIWVEAFCGAAWVTLAKTPSPVEVINDLDRGLANFYQVLRDPILSPRLQGALELSPYSRTEYETCRATYREEADSVEWARRWYVVARQGIVGGFGTAGWSYCSDGGDSTVRRYVSAIRDFGAVHARLRSVQVECQDWRKLLAVWNKPQTLLYCDPPYVLTTRRGGKRYSHEMTDDDHRDLVAALLDWRGNALLSGYVHPLYAPLETAGWRRLDFDTLAHSTGSTKHSPIKQSRTESLWLNYDPATVRGQGVLALEDVS